MGILVSAHLNWGFSQRILHSGSDRTLENKPSITLFYCSFLFTTPNKDIEGHRGDLFCSVLSKTLLSIKSVGSLWLLAKRLISYTFEEN